MLEINSGTHMLRAVTKVSTKQLVPLLTALTDIVEGKYNHLSLY